MIRRSIWSVEAMTKRTWAVTEISVLVSNCWKVIDWKALCLGGVHCASPPLLVHWPFTNSFWCLIEVWRARPERGCDLSFQNNWMTEDTPLVIFSAEINALDTVGRQSLICVVEPMEWSPSWAESMQTRCVHKVKVQYQVWKSSFQH